MALYKFRIIIIIIITKVASTVIKLTTPESEVMEV